jgi:hypothetical protein
MIRKSTLVVVPAIAFALTLFASVNSTSQAFAKGGAGHPGGNRMGMGREHRDNWRKDFRYNRNWDRFCFGYPVYGCVEAPVCGCEVVTQPVVPVVEAPVVEAPVCTTCAPVLSSYEGFGGYFGYRHDRREFRHRERPLERGGRMGHGKK